jgi:hypothetical protein
LINFYRAKNKLYRQSVSGHSPFFVERYDGRAQLTKGVDLT